MKILELQDFEKKLNIYREKINIQITESERVFKKIAGNFKIEIIINDSSFLSWADNRIRYIVKDENENISTRPLIECKFPIRQMIVNNGNLDKLIDKVILILNKEMETK